MSCARSDNYWIELSTEILIVGNFEIFLECSEDRIVYGR